MINKVNLLSIHASLYVIKTQINNTVALSGSIYLTD